MSEFKKENEHLFEQSKPSGRTPDDGGTPQKTEAWTEFL